MSLFSGARRLLDAGGFQVKTFSSAEDFLDRANPTTPGCLVLDVHLGGSAVELLERLVGRRRQIPVVFITAHDERDAGPGAPRRPVEYLESLRRTNR